VAQGEEEHDEDFTVRLEALQEELVVLNNEVHELEQTIAENVVKILDSV
jgi:type I restriction enzyme M protein